MPKKACPWRQGSRAARQYYLIGGKAPKVGQVFRAPGQAEVLRRIADQGRAGFYSGEVADDMVSSLRALGGSHTLTDFDATACSYGTPISGSYRSFDLVEHPPNGQGVTAILLGNILQAFDIAKLDPFGAQRAHLEAEAAILAYEARDRFLSDPDHMTHLDHLLSPETGARLAALINPDRAGTAPAPRTEAIHRDTVYITVVDRDRMAVSLIYSVYWSFGAGFASDKFGINFQNRGAGFTLTQGHPNEAGGGKRPMHTIIPAMLRQGGRVVMPYGVMGGAYQPTGHMRVLSNLADFGMDLQSALDAPRSFMGEGDGMEVERGYAPEIRTALSAMGHKVNIPDIPLGGAQAIWMDGSGTLIGASDPRKDGCALGY
jgi:gamma-glutamyltranspeptidase / glutathione hydrolase